jgi:hypothetical protein
MFMKKILAIFGVIVAIGAMVLLALQLISPLVFWIVLGVSFVIAYYIMPKLQK